EVTQLADGACGLSDGSTAGKWRLPNLNELESLIDVAASAPALSIGNPFDHVSSDIYWTSTSYFGGEGGSPKAWTIRLSDGLYMNDSTSNVKATANNGVWAVKGTLGGAIQLQATECTCHICLETTAACKRACGLHTRAGSTTETARSPIP